MTIRIQKTFEALFALEEIRGIFRESLPTGLEPEEDAAFRQRIADLKAIVADLEARDRHAKGDQDHRHHRCPHPRRGIDQHPANPGCGKADDRGKESPHLVQGWLLNV